jgi:hypothetical protein
MGEFIEDTIANISEKVKINGKLRSLKTWSEFIRLNPTKKDGSPIFCVIGERKLPGKGRPAAILRLEYPQNTDNISFFVE